MNQKDSPSHIGAHNDSGISEIETNNEVGQLKYAGFWIRLAAYFIDGLLILLILVVTNLLGFITANILNSGQPYWADNTADYLTLLDYFAFFAVPPSYFILMTYKYGVTIGKMVMGIKVIPDDSNFLTLKQIIKRETFGKIASFIFLAGFIMAGISKKKQAFHDEIAKTLVIYSDPNKIISGWRKVLTWVIPIIITCYLLFDLFIYPHIPIRYLNFCPCGLSILCKEISYPVYSCPTPDSSIILCGHGEASACIPGSLTQIILNLFYASIIYLPQTIAVIANIFLPTALGAQETVVFALFILFIPPIVLVYSIKSVKRLLNKGFYVRVILDLAINLLLIWYLISSCISLLLIVEQS